MANEKKAELSRLINLLVEFEEKLESQIHKKYKQFVRNMLSINVLVKTITEQKMFITKEIIVFKLGLESKSVKCIQLTLDYLFRMLQLDYIELVGPDYSENFVICENEVKEVEVKEYSNTAKKMLEKVLTPLVHFKNDDINNILSKNLEYFIGEDILHVLLLFSNKPPANFASLIYSYFSFRIYLYEELNIYSERQLRLIQQQVPRIDKLTDQIKKALTKREEFENFIKMYLDQVVDRIVKDGGKYGHCVICKKHADFYCKDTRVSLCSSECKMIHLEKATKYQQDIYKSNCLIKQIYQSFQELLEFIGKQQKQIKSRMILIELVDVLLNKPYVFLLINNNFLKILKKYLPDLIKILLKSSITYLKQLGFNLMCSISKYFKPMFMDMIEIFFCEEIIKRLQEKKPKFESIKNILNFLKQLFKNGRNVIELYVNFDCKINRENIIQLLMYELAKILQDKYLNSNIYNKAEIVKLRNDCIDVHNILLENLSQFSKSYPSVEDVSVIETDKLKKINVEKLLFKFNENWREGIKVIFNSNIASLDNRELIKVFKKIAKLKKLQLEAYFFSDNKEELIAEYINLIDFKQNPIVKSLIDFYQLFPLNSSICRKIFMEEYRKYHQGEKVEEQVQYWIKIFSQDPDRLTNSYLADELKDQITNLQEVAQVRSRIIGLQNGFTAGQISQTYIHCNSHTYLSVFESQLNLIQISVSHLLQAQYSLNETLSFMKNLQTVSSTSNVFILLIKSSKFEFVLSQRLGEDHITIINFIIMTPDSIPDSVPEWFSLFRFYNDIYHFSISACLTPISLANKTLILSTSSLSKLESNLLRIARKISVNKFKDYALAMLKIGNDEACLDHTFLLQKFFEIMESEMEKALENWPAIFAKIKTTALNICFNLNQPISIFTIDLLKQNLIKLLHANVEQQIESSYFELFQYLYENLKSKEVKEFLLSCIAMITEHHFSIYLTSWKIVLSIMLNAAKEQIAEFKPTIYTVVQKIMSENLLFLIDYFEEFFQILFNLISILDTKISIKALIDIRVLIDFLIKQSSNTETDSPLKPVNFESPTKQNAKRLLKLLLQRSLVMLADRLKCDFHDTVIEVFFVLIKRNFTRQEPILSLESINHHFDNIFNAIVQFPAENRKLLTIAEKFIQESVSWGARLKYYYTVQGLGKCILGVYQQLSFIAMKGIKTFIQILNPKNEEEWSVLSHVLSNIIEDCRLSAIFEITEILNDIKNIDFLASVQANLSIKSEIPVQNCDQLMNKMVIQKMCIELLPNDINYLTKLESIYDQIRDYNDNIYLRCILWKKGLGKGCDDLPSLLVLEEIVINRILSIYNFNKNKLEFYYFTNQILQRYCRNCELELQIQERLNLLDNDNIQFQLYTQYSRDIKKKKSLLSKIVSYLLPKLVDINIKAQIAVILGESIIHLTEHYEPKDLPIKILKNLIRVRD